MQSRTRTRIRPSNRNRPPPPQHQLPPDEPPGYSFDDLDTIDSTPHASWVPGPDVPANVHMTTQEMEALITDSDQPMWPERRPTQTSTHDHIGSSPDQVQQLQLHHLSPSAHNPTADIKQEFQQIQRQPQPISPVQQQHMLQSYQHASTPQQFISPPHHSNIPQNSPSSQAAALPGPTSATTRGFSLPQTIAGAHYLNHDRDISHPQPLRHHTPDEQLPASHGDESVDPEKYVLMASDAAEKAKLEHRTILKDLQRTKEEAAENKGEPLSAKDKERERSRRESAVTRKRAEVYIYELERVVRQVPRLQQQIAKLHLEVSRLQNLHQQSQLSTPNGMRNNMQRSESVKREPGLLLSPDSANTTRIVTSGLTQLDL